MMLSAHSLIRYLERFEGMPLDAERAVCAAEHGLHSPNAIDCGRFLRWLRENGLLDTAHWSAVCMEAILAGRVNPVMDRDGTVITVLPLTEKPYVPTREVDPWRDPVSRAARRRIIAEERFDEESHREISPRRRRL